MLIGDALLHVVHVVRMLWHVNGRCEICEMSGRALRCLLSGFNAEANSLREQAIYKIHSSQ